MFPTQDQGVGHGLVADWKCGVIIFIVFMFIFLKLIFFFKAFHTSYGAVKSIHHQMCPSSIS